jgi:hypothetical protein
MDYLAQAKNAIEKSHHCSAIHQETVPVRNEFEGKIAWEGDVEVFAISGNPTAQIVYAWGYLDEREVNTYRFTTVLNAPPVSSAETAVRVAMVNRAKLERDSRREGAQAEPWPQKLPPDRSA